ncbi:hypothetical protein ABBQ38_010530 [Trebouxia sp. C0009 RCD-2024]
MVTLLMFRTLRRWNGALCVGPFERCGNLVQVAACVNAVREDPDGFACQYPCDYSQWRSDVISPARGSLISAGTDGADQLDQTAIEHSTDMAVNAYFSHLGSNNRTLQDRAEEFGFDTFPLGENIAAGYNTVRDVVLAWMCSAGHRTNLMGCGFDTVGTGVIQNDTAPYKIYYTQDFGCSLDTQPTPSIPTSPCSQPTPSISTSPCTPAAILPSSTSPTPVDPSAASDSSPSANVVPGAEVPAVTPTPTPPSLPDFSQRAGFSVQDIAVGPAAETYQFSPASLPGATPPAPPSAVNASGCLYTTYMEHHGSSGQLAVTNMDTVVIVASFDTNVSSLPASAVQLQLDSGQGGVVSEVQGFPGQPNVFLIEVQHPVGYEGRVTVSLPADAVQPLSYNVVRRPLVVQNLGIDVCSAT